MKIIISGGGIGGHVYPAISIVEAILDRDSSTQVLYIGASDSIEQKVAKKSDIDFFSVKSYSFYSKNIFHKVILSIKLFLSSFSIISKMKNFDPDVIIGTGGYIMCPVMIVALLLRKKIFLHEQNVVPGTTTRFFSKFATKVFVSYSESVDKFNIPRSRIEITGNPIRSSFCNVNRRSEKAKLGYEDKFVILSFGESADGKSINDFVLHAKEYIESNSNLEWIHITNDVYYDRYCNDMKDLKNFKVYKCLDDNISSYYGASDLIISRSEAMTLSQISSVGVASILVSSSVVSNDYQYQNALLYKNEGAAFIVEDSKLKSSSTYDIIDKLIDDDKLRNTMANNSKNLALLGASYIIADRVLLGE